MPNTTIADDLVIRRHHLPHWQQGGRAYFVTFRSARGELPDEARDIVCVHALHDHGRRYDLYAGVVMPDHVHLLFRPLEKEDGVWYDLAEIMQGIKGTSARRINQTLRRSGSVWQRETHDHIIRDEEDFREKWTYIRNNPIKKGLATERGEYRWYIRPEDAPESRVGDQGLRG